MDALLPIEEIEATYPDEWVLLTDIESDPGPVVRRARVVWHSTDRDECWAKADTIPPPATIGVFYMGEPFEDGVVPIL
jgi:hypothetical protein